MRRRRRVHELPVTPANAGVSPAQPEDAQRTKGGQGCVDSSEIHCATVATAGVVGARMCPRRHRKRSAPPNEVWQFARANGAGGRGFRSSFRAGCEGSMPVATRNVLFALERTAKRTTSGGQTNRSTNNRSHACSLLMMVRWPAYVDSADVRSAMMDNYRVHRCTPSLASRGSAHSASS